MAIHTSNRVAYGIRVAENIYDTIDWDRREAIEAGLKAGPVELMCAGAHDRQMGFLVIGETWRTLEPGHCLHVGPYAATDTEEHPYPDWDWALVDAAQRSDLPVLASPGWLFVPSED